MNNNGCLSNNQYYKDYDPYRPKKPKSRLPLIVILSSAGALVIVLGVIVTLLLLGAGNDGSDSSLNSGSLANRIEGSWSVDESEIYFGRHKDTSAFSVVFNKDNTLCLEKKETDEDGTTVYKINGKWEINDAEELRLVLSKDDLENYRMDDVEDDETVIYRHTGHPAMIAGIDSFNSGEEETGSGYWYISDSALYLSDCVMYDNTVILSRVSE